MNFVFIDDLMDNANLPELDDVCTEMRECGYGSGYICDVIAEIADRNTSIYYSDIFKFAQEHTEYVERAIDESWGGDLIKAIQFGEYIMHEETLYGNLADILRYIAYDHLIDSGYIEIPEALADAIDEWCEEEDHNNRMNHIPDMIDQWILDNEACMIHEQEEAE